MKTSELLLGVNIDHVATLRQARGTRYPDPVHARYGQSRLVLTALPYICVKTGHGLNRQNISAIASLLPVRELNIGHAIIADSIFIGLEKTIVEYKRLMRESRS